MQFRHQLLDAGIGDAVPEGLAVAAKGHDVLVAHLCQMLRQRRLAEADRADQRADGHFAGFHQFAEDHQPPLVAERAQEICDLQRVGREVLNVGRLGLWHRRPLN